MKYGNCLFGALVLLYTEHHNNPKFILRVRPDSLIPHFMIRTKDSLIHYRVTRDILPFPLCYIIFEGRFQSIGLDEEEHFHKRRSLIGIK